MHLRVLRAVQPEKIKRRQRPSATIPDPAVRGEAHRATVTQVPTLVLTADTFDMLWPSTGRKVLDAWAQRAMGGGAEVHALHVCGSKHQNFADFTALAPDITQGMGLAGERDPHAVLAFVNALDVRLPPPPFPSVLTGHASSLPPY